MVDSIQVFPPGFRVTDNNGNLITDGILSFFDAGTSDPKTVYSDANLSVSLGTTVNCNSAGYPVTSGNAKTLVYTGSDLYKVRLSSVLFGGTVAEHDNVRGAVNTASFLTSAVAADRTIVPVSTNRTTTVSDKGKLLNVNVTSGTLTITFDPASTLGSGFWCGVSHNGTANQVKIIGNGTDTFRHGGVSTTAFSLTAKGHTVWIACDGTSFTVENELPGLIGNTTGIIQIVTGSLGTPPGSPTPGARYILSGSLTGAWASFAVNDIAEATGSGGWIRYTPPADCGWIAYVQDQDLNYQYRGTSWVVYGPPATTTQAGFVRLATDAEMETPSSFTLAVPPANMHRHPGVAKAWAYVNVPGGVPVVLASHNIGSIVDGGVGILSIVYITSFSSANYCPIVSSFAASTGIAHVADFTASNVVVHSRNAGNTLQDPFGVMFVAFGDF